MIDFHRLVMRRDFYTACFARAEPFKHVTIDSFLAAEAARVLEQSFPAPVRATLTRNFMQDRYLDRNYRGLPEPFVNLYAEIREPRFVSWLEAVTGITNLEPDTREQVELGLIQSVNGGYHNVHADPNMHAERDLFRRVTLLLYLNEIWQPLWGGSLELWSSDMKRLVTSIEPSFNRCLIMENHDHAYHGYRQLRTPADVTRKAMCLIYFAPQPAEQQSLTRHRTKFRMRPDDSLLQRAGHILAALRSAAGAVRNSLFRRNVA